MALTKEYFFQRVRKDSSGCWIWTGARDPKGYAMMSAGRKKRYRASRWSYETFVEPVESWIGFDCCHKCDNPPCVNPDHLFKGTRSDNMKDAGSKRRHWTQVHKEDAARNTKAATRASLQKISGSKNRLAKFDADSLREVLSLIRDGISDTQIAKQFKCSRTAIYQIRTGKKYKAELEAIALEANGSEEKGNG